MLISIRIKIKTTTKIVERKWTNFLKLICEIAKSLLCPPLFGCFT